MRRQNPSSISGKKIVFCCGRLLQDLLLRRSIVRMFLLGMGCLAFSYYAFAANPQDESIVAKLKAYEERIEALEAALNLKEGKIQRLDVVEDIGVGSIRADAITVGKKGQSAFYFGTVRTDPALPVMYGYYNGESSHRELFRVHANGDVTGHKVKWE